VNDNEQTAGEPIFPAWATAGYQKESGEWLINLGLPTNNQPAELNQFAIHMALTIPEALEERCRVAKITYNAHLLDARGQVAGWREVEPAPTSAGGRTAAHVTLGELAARDHLVYDSLFLDCDLKVLMVDPGGEAHELWVPYAATGYFGYYFDHQAKEAQRCLVPKAADMSLQTHINVWRAETLSPHSKDWQDNTATARLNQPWLEAALRRWEQLVGKPIVEWGWYRYGFPPVEKQLS
jgi:hypothetical protein